MKFIIGYKQAMTQQYREDGTLVPVTVVKAEPLTVTQVKSSEKDGYQAVQLGVGTKNHVNKSAAGHMKSVLKDGQKPFHRLREIRVEDTAQFELGDTVTVSTFEAGDKVAVTGTSKGKGFQGVVKRHNFGGSPASHGHKDQLRMPGSIGSQDPQRVFKGMKMAGRMGGNVVTVKNLEIVSIDADNNLLFVKGALPGSKNTLITIVGEGELVKGENVLAAPVKEEKAEETTEPKNEEVKEESTEATETKSEEPKADESKDSEAKEESK